MTYDQVIGMLKEACRQTGGQKAWGDLHGVKPQHLGDIIHGRRALTETVLRPLGLVRTVSYDPVEGKS